MQRPAEDPATVLPRRTSLKARTRALRGLPHVVLGLALAWGNGIEAQEPDKVWGAFVGINLPGPSVSRGEGLEVSASTGVLVGVAWDRPVGRRFGLQAQGDVALGTTVVMTDGRSECRDDHGVGGARFCTSKGSPQIGVLRLTGGPLFQTGFFHVGVGAGARVDLGGWQAYDCVMLDRSCLALQDYPWPGLSAQLRATGGWSGTVAGRSIRVEVGEWMAPRSGGRLRERSVTVGLAWR